MDISNEQLAEQLELIARLVEWNYPLDYTIYLTEAAYRLRAIEPVKYAHWIPVKHNCGLKCSNCGGRARYSDKRTHKYCAFCGAKIVSGD